MIIYISKKDIPLASWVIYPTFLKARHSHVIPGGTATGSDA